MTTCFVIGPIGDRFAAHGSETLQTYEDAVEIFERVIIPACNANEIDPVRADQIAASGDINDQVFRHLRDDDVVVADVSGGNANVMYELGIRHTTGKLTIHIGEFGQLPFDISAIRTIRFSRSKSGLIEARRELEQALAYGLAEGPELMPAARIMAQSDEVVSSPPDGGSAVETKNEDDVSDIDKPGLIDRMASVEEDFPQLSETTGEIGEVLEEIGSVTWDASEEIKRVDASSGTAGARLSVLSRFAQQLEEPTVRLESLVTNYDATLSGLDEAMREILSHLDGMPEELSDERVVDFLESILSMAASAREGMEGINNFGSSAQEMGAISKRLRRPGNRLRTATRLMAAATSKIDLWEGQARRLIDKGRVAQS